MYFHMNVVRNPNLNGNSLKISSKHKKNQFLKMLSIKFVYKLNCIGFTNAHRFHSNLSLKDQKFISASKRGVNTKVPSQQKPLLHFVIIYGTVPMTCSNFRIVHMKGLETSFPGKKINS